MRRLSVVFVAMLVFGVLVAEAGLIVLVNRLEARVQALENRIVEDELTISVFKHSNAEVRLGLLEATAAENAVYIREHGRQINGLRERNTPQAVTMGKVRGAEILSDRGNKEASRALVFAAMAEMAGTTCTTPYEPRFPTALWNFFAKDSPYHIGVGESANDVFRDVRNEACR